jgi:tetratricopeptide (TPR) repeat protein
MAESSGPWILGRYHQEFGTTLRDLATAESRHDYFEEALGSFHKALYEFEAVGNHRYVAAVRNNIGYVLLALGRLNETEAELQRARKLFEQFGDAVRCSQVEETMAQLYMVQGQFELAEKTINRAVTALENADEDALLSEALLTHGQVLLRLNRQSEAKRAFDGAYRIADRCGHHEGAGVALLMLLEELPHRLLPDERLAVVAKMKVFLQNSQQTAIKDRMRHCIESH